MGFRSAAAVAITSLVVLLAASCGQTPSGNGNFVYDPDSMFAYEVLQASDSSGVDVSAGSDAGGDGAVEGDVGAATGDATAADTAAGDSATGDTSQVDSAGSDGAGGDGATGCKNAGECDDGDICTSDACVAGKCKNTAIPSCGKQAQPCDAKNPCAKGVCDDTNHVCVECKASKDCGGGKICAGNHCITGPACKSDVDCKANGQVCNKSASICVECNVAADCGANSTCIEAKCMPSPDCASSKDCDKVCDFSKGKCVDCMSSEDCAAGQYCSSAKICKPAVCQANACGPGLSFFVCAPGGGGYMAGVACEDGKPCTNNTCAPDKGCATKFNTIACDDGDKCTEKDVCSAGTCSGTPALCDDGNPCTTDSCDTLNGCGSVPINGACDDGDSCTTGDTCQGMSCMGTPKDCNDGQVCTLDTCDPKQGCVHDANSAPCDDKNLCTQNDKCVSGQCFGDAKNCDDGNPCTNDSCNPVSGCTKVNNSGNCDDGNACTSNDTCSGGACYAGVPKNCNDNNPCTNDSCANGLCQYANNTAACSDNDPCTVGDVCAAGSCLPGKVPQTCNDNNACTDDACKTGLGCQYTPNTQPCDDKNACTNGDTCAASVCKPGAPVVCDDKDGCTKDSCDPLKGCGAVPDVALCDDKDVCTTDSCASPAGTCKHDATPNCCTKQAQCDDGSTCTTDICAGNQCLHTQNGTCCSVDSDCGDGTLCTADTCVLGKCQHTKLADPPAALGPNDWENLGDLEGWSPGPSVGGLYWAQATGKGSTSGTGALYFGKGGAAITGIVVPTQVEVVSQTFVVPAGGATTLTMQWKQDWAGLSSPTYPPLQAIVKVAATNKTWVAWSGAYNATKAFALATIDLTPMAGQTVTLTLKGSMYGSATTPASGTGVLVDDLKVNWTCTAKACTTDANCANTAPCSDAICVQGTCSYSYKCCAAASDCDDKVPCTTDACSVDKCVHTKAAGCCLGNSDCADSNVCTFDVCGADNKCAFSGVAECCTAASQCDDKDTCTIDTCNAGTCTYKNTCCKADLDCNDKDDICTIDKCVAGACVYTGTGKPGCCLPTIWEEHFDGSNPLANWTISGSAGKAPGWQVWSTPVSPPGPKTAPAVLYYGNPATKNFDNGLSNSGVAKGPKIILPATATKLTFSANLYINTEQGGKGSFDDLVITVYADGVKQATDVWNKSAPGLVFSSWVAISGDLTPYKGKTIELEFSFNTLDSIANSGLGVLLDDIKVEQTCP